MHRRVLICFLLGLMLLPAGCKPRSIFQSPPQPKFNPHVDKSLELAQSLKPDESLAGLHAKLPDLLRAFASARERDKPRVYEAIGLLAKQPRIVQAIRELYAPGDPATPVPRLFLLSVLGEMRHPEAREFLAEIVRTPPPNVGPAHGVGPRERAEMLQAKAAEGLAYYRDSGGDALVLEVVRSHPSRHVRIAAMDAYLWNHADSVKAEAYLKTQVPPDLWPYLGRPRFRRGTDVDEFQREMAAWQQQWSTSP